MSLRPFIIFIEYLLFINYILIVGSLGSILFYISWFFNTSMFGRRRFAIYECGFRSLGGSYKPFTAQYYILALMFLLFDIELLFLFPWIGSLSFYFMVKSFVLVWIFSSFLIISYFYEILKGSLNWYDGNSQLTLKKKILHYRLLNFK